MEDKIVSIASLAEYIGVGPGILSRWLRLDIYDFPAPHNVVDQNGFKRFAWFKKEVNDWINNNLDSVTTARTRRLNGEKGYRNAERNRNADTFRS